MKFLRILLFVLSLTTALVVSAYDFEVNGLYFDIVSTADLTCALTDGPSGHKYTGALVIPDEVEYSGKKLKVVSIACKLPEIYSVQFSKNTESICRLCFYSNKLITSIIFPSSINEIGVGAFQSCTSLTSVKWEGDMVLSSSIFEECPNLKELSYKSICKKIPHSAFRSCSSLTSLDLSSVEEIEYYAFNGCKSLNKITLPSIQSIAKYAFNDCENISLLTLGSDISTIESNTFDGCIIDSLAILPSETKITIGKFATTTLKKLYLGRSIKTAYPSTYNNKFSESDVASVRVGPQVTELGACLFKDCKKLSKITFEGTDIVIGSQCFYGTSLKAISLPIGVNKLYQEVFPNDIEIISFGSEVNFISNNDIFANIKNSSALKQISFLSVKPPYIDEQFGYGFGNNVYTSVKLLVPYGSKEAYQKADVWKNFWNIEEMPGVNTEKVEIEPVNTSLNVGDTIRLTGTKYPANSIDTIQWKSSDVKIATVSHDGFATAVAPGKTTITAISGKATATCEVTVLPINAEKIALSYDKVSINESDTLRITATISPDNTTDKTVKWTSSDEKVAKVSSDGLISAIGAGTATITAACGEISATCEVTVYEPNIGIEFTDNTLAITVEASGSAVNISVFTVFGQCVYRQSTDASIVVKEEIDLSKLPAGTYITQVISGAMNASKRIVKTETK